MILTDTALNAVGNYFKDAIDKAQYRESGVWYDVELTDRLFTPGMRLVFSFEITAHNSDPVTAVRLVDEGGNVWVSRNENIDAGVIGTGIQYRFFVNLLEEE